MAGPNIEEHPGSIFVGVVAGNFTETDAQALFGELTRRILAAAGTSTIIYDARTLSDFELAILDRARAMLKATDAKLLGVGVISESARTKFALSALQMATRRNLRSFPTLEEGLTWARGLVDRRKPG